MSGHAKHTALLIAALAVLAGARVAQAQPGARAALRLAHADYNDQEYERVVKRVDAVLISPGLTRTLRVEALRLKAFAHVVLGQRAKAAAAFERLLEINPQFRLPSGESPGILTEFDTTLARWLRGKETALRERLGADLAAMRLVVSVAARSRGGLPLPVQVSLTDPKRLAKELIIFYRRKGQRSYSRIRARARGQRTAVDIPGVFTASKLAYRLDVYVEVMHKSGFALLRHGSAAKPVAVAMSAGAVPRPTPVYKKWWFWLGATVLAVTVPLLIDQAIDVGPQTVTGTRN